jgi:hypothetical protein
MLLHNMLVQKSINQMGAEVIEGGIVLAHDRPGKSL